MVDYIIKLSDEGRDFYLLWSTIVDAPACNGMSLDEFKKFYKKRYEIPGVTIIDQKGFADRLRKVEETGCSALHETLEGLLSNNQAGKNDKTISKKEIIRRYCHKKQS